MKTIRLTTILSLLLWATACEAQMVATNSQSAPTNTAFRFGGGGGEVLEAEDTVELVIKKLSGKFATEFLPASQDTNGNWGDVVNGSQLSVRTYATNFSVGSPLPVVILWRNDGQSTVSFPMGGGINYPFLLTLRYENELLTPRVPPSEGELWGAIGARPIAPQSQYRFVVRLDKIFDLSRHGRYELYAERWIPDGKYWEPPVTNHPRALARSGTLKFTLQPAEDSTNSEPSPDAEPK